MANSLCLHHIFFNMPRIISRFLSPFSLFILSVLILGSLYQCTSPTPPPERGHTPWVFRSVLDLKPRVVTLALHKDLWVAYDANSCGLFKVWKKGVNFDGPVFTTRHGPQPTSIGPAYVINEVEQPWRLRQNGEETPVKAVYRGHLYKNDRAYLTYEIPTANGTITLTESPEYLKTNAGNTGLERVFEVKDMPQGIELVLHFNLGSISSEKAISTNGTLEVIDTQPVTHTFHKIITLQGKLTLNSTGQTQMKVSFLKEPMLVNTFDQKKEDLAASPAKVLIEKNGCETCHNEATATVGPAYLDVAKKYPYTLKTIEQLANKVISGGSGVWGDQMMLPNAHVSYEDAVTMVEYVMALDGETPIEGENVRRGIAYNFYDFEDGLTQLPSIPEARKADWTANVRTIDQMNKEFDKVDNPFAIHYKGFLNINKSDNYVFRLMSADGSRLTLDGQVLIDNDGIHAYSGKDAEMTLEAGTHEFLIEYFSSGGSERSVSLEWVQHGKGDFEPITRAFYSYEPNQLKPRNLPDPTEVPRGDIPGDRYPVVDVHPSYDLSQARPNDFRPKVGGMDFLSDGRMVISTWTPEGTVYLLEGAQTGDTSQMSYKAIASGLAEPLGLKVVDDEIYVLQKQELTKLIDHDGDEVIDEYRTVCGAWQVSANFHEFAFGMVYKDGHFYATLATAIEPGGKSTQPQLADRGKVIKISKADGSHTFVAHGLRTPNGIGLGIDNEIFVADNQGDWLPASKIVHVQEGAWFGSRSVDFEGTATLTETKPMVWLPQDEIGNSPTTPLAINDGPYKGQMIHGEITNGGVKRVFVENINGQYQGVVFRFVQGIEAAVNRLVWGPDGALYIGGIGSTGNWQDYNKLWYGLQRIKYNEKSTFEMLAVRAKSNGMEIEFTGPLAPGKGLLPADYEVKQWYYLPTVEYGGPKLDEKALAIQSVNVSDDRKKVFLELEGMEENHVVYIRLAGPLISESGQGLWAKEAWYTLNHIPQNLPGYIAPNQYTSLDNQLTPEEEAAGWILLFDGKTKKGWRKYRGKKPGKAWKVKGGALVLSGRKNKDGNFVHGGTIITDQAYENYELTLDWRISENGNSGIIYNVQELDDAGAAYDTGPEMQVLHDEGHPDGQIPLHRAGDLYDMIECTYKTVKQPGEWNHIRIVNHNGKIEHWLNGYKVVEYDMNSPEWPKMIEKSKFNGWKHFGKYTSGHIALQDHHDVVAYKNIKLRKLE